MNYLMYLRLRRGLSQKDLAELLKIHPVVMCKVERGWFTRPPKALEERLQAVFGREWTFSRLMEAVPDITANDSDAA